jgi:hypothetical protein
MAEKKKKRMRTSSYRQDYRKGGRVAMAKGGPKKIRNGENFPEIKNKKKRKPNNPKENNITVSPDEPTENKNIKIDENVDNISRPKPPPKPPAIEEEEKTNTNTDTTPTVDSEYYLDNPEATGELTPDDKRDDPTDKAPFSGQLSRQQQKAQREREYRAAQTGERLEQMATGQVGLKDVGAFAETAAIGTAKDDEMLKQTEDTKVQSGEEYTGLAGEDYKADETAIADETVSGIEDVGQVDEKRKGFDAAQITEDELATVPEEVKIAAAETGLSEGAILREDELAKAAGIKDVPRINTAEVEIREGALQERVTGTISEEAKQDAIEMNGLNLRRVTRAKKQLSRAGVSADIISEIGNNPEALEDALMDIPEEERGVIEGLPEEALVSTQMDGLLTGIENGEVPTWARPAVAKVEAMLARRGMSASSVGRDSLMTAIIGAATPIAMANAQAIQSAVAQEKSIASQERIKEAELNTQIGMNNANNVFKMDMAQFNADVQQEVSNSRFLQTVSMQDATFKQQGAVQDIVMMSQRNMAEADATTKLAIQQAQAFLSMDMKGVDVNQQARMVEAAQEQQRMLSNQGARNAAAQINAKNEQQTMQFMEGLNAQMSQFNVSQSNASKQFNATQNNLAEARRVGRETDIAKFNSQLAAQIDQFTEQQGFAREQFNATNALVIQQSNAQWQRDISKIDTAAQNAQNSRNAQNAFAMSQTAQAQLFQEMRDEFDYIWKSSENAENRKTNIAVAAMQSDGSLGKGNDKISRIKSFLSWFDT